MNFLEVEKLRVSDPLSEVTRKERRTLLGVSTIGVAIVKTGLVPTQVSALGIDLTSSDQTALLTMMALSTGYFLAAFIIYAISDFVAWRLGRISLAYAEEAANYESGRQQLISEWKLTPEQAEDLRRLEASEEMQQLKTSEGNMWRGTYWRHGMWAEKAVPPVSIGRTAFDFVLPVVVGVYAIVLLAKGP